MRSTYIASITGALASAFVPIASILRLNPTDYAQFSIIYLVFALGISLQLSLVCDPWSRVERRSLEPDSRWNNYAASIAQLALIFALVTYAASTAAGISAGNAIIFSIAIAASIARLGLRYNMLFMAGTRQVIYSDLLSIAGYSTIFILPTGQLEDITLSALSWLSGSALSLLAYPLISVSRQASLYNWLKSYRTEVRALLPDSILMDIGAIGAPFIIVGILSPQAFGIYRAISNVALPVRLILDPLRPKLAGVPASTLCSARWLLSVGAVSLSMGVLASMTLTFFIGNLPSEIGTLTSLTPLSAQAGLYVTTAFVGQYAYIGCRATCAASELLSARLVQTSTMIFLPAIGAVSASLPGAAWGFVAASGISAVKWVLVLRTQGRAA